MTENNNKLNEEQLKEVAGGIGNDTQYQEGDMVTVFNGEYYYFGTILSIISYHKGKTTYTVSYTRSTYPRGGYIEVMDQSGECYFDAEDDNYKIIKKIASVPEPKWYQYHQLAPYIAA